MPRSDPATGRRLASIPVGATTYDLTDALGSVWVTNRNGGTFQRISPATNRVVRTVAFPPGSLPAGIGYAGGALWVGDDHGRFVTRLDPRTYRLTRVRSGGVGASWIAVDGADVWVSNTKSGSVSRIDARTRRLVSMVKVGISPVNLDVIGGDVWVPDDLGDKVVRIDADTGTVEETLPARPQPGGRHRRRRRRLGLDVRRLADLADPPRMTRQLLLATAALVIGGGALAGAAAPPATVTARIAVGSGAGVPAVDGGTVWVPATRLGSVVRVDAAGKRVVKRISLAPRPGSPATSTRP